MGFKKQMIFYLFIFPMEYTMENKTDRKSVGLRIQELRKKIKKLKKTLQVLLARHQTPFPNLKMEKSA